MKRILTAITLLLTISLTAMAEAIGTWTLYPSYSEISQIVPTGKKVFVLASQNLYSYDPSDGGLLETYTKSNVLNDNSISCITWVPAVKRLLIAYNNANIDLLDLEGNVIAAPEFHEKVMNVDKTINSTTVYGNIVYISTNFGIIKFNAATGDFLDTYILGYKINHCYIKDGYLYASSPSYQLRRCKLTDNLVDPNNWPWCGPYEQRNDNFLNVEDKSHNCWWTAITQTDKHGTFLTSYTIDPQTGERVYQSEGIRPDGPADNKSYRLNFHKGTLYVVPGAYDVFMPGSADPTNVMYLQNEEWGLFQNNITEITGLRYQDNNCVAVDPLNSSHVFAGGKNGLHEFMDGKHVKSYYYKDEGVPFATADPSSSNPKNWTVVQSMAFDKEGNLWIPQMCNNSVICLTKDHEWKAYNHADLLKHPFYNHMLSAQFNSKGELWWVSSFWDNSRVYRYDITTDNLTRNNDFFNQDNSKITAYLKCLCEDKKGNMWVGTHVGPFYLTPEDIKAGNWTFTQHKVPRNDGTNLADYLLTGVNVNVIRVDAANRKWIGTESGLFLISDDCNTQIANFTTENSSIPSNSITDIAIDDETGRIWMATTSGLCSYMSDITKQTMQDISNDNVWAYPNPVTPEHTGMITIVGLQPECDVKILTASGTLVSEGFSTGGSYQWDGCNLQGERVASGVYMVNAVTSDGNKGIVTKIAVVR